jgi:hypothetical protein
LPPGLNPACRHEALIDVSSCPEETEVPSVTKKVVCAMCDAQGRDIEVKPIWKDQTPQASLTGKDFR